MPNFGKNFGKNQTFECHLFSLLRGCNTPKSHSKGKNWWRIRISKNFWNLSMESPIFM